MILRRVLVAATVGLALWSVSSWSAEPAREPTPEATGTSDPRFDLDEYGIMTSDASGEWQVAVGATFGNSIKKDYYYFFGGRLSWLRVLYAGNISDGVAVGGMVGVSCRPTQQFTPIATFAVDYPFSLDDTYNLKLTTSAGVRVRVQPMLDTHYALSFMAFRSDLMGSGSVPNTHAYGVSMTYSIAFYDQH